MNQPRLGLVLFLAGCSLLVSGDAPPANSAPALAPAPAYNWVLPLFSDQEGFRTMTARGTNVRPAEAGAIAVTDLNIWIYTGDASERIETVLLSREAKFFPKEQRATGDGAVRLIRDDAEVTGEGWTYEHAAKKVSLHRNVRVVFTAPLNEFLK